MNNLFIVGAQRSGSTYLYYLLKEHPHVFMAGPVRPEPKYFMNKEMFDKGKVHYMSLYFSEISPQIQYCGEKSVSYCEHPVAAERVANFFPDARILFILRNPVDRAFSNYCFSVDNKLETLSFEEALDMEDKRLGTAQHTTSVNPFAYRKRGHYIDCINIFLKYFHPRQIKVLIFEEFVSNLQNIQGLYRWLGIQGEFVPSGLKTKINTLCVPELKSAKKKDSCIDLVKHYQQSVIDLEDYLNRPVLAWRDKWAAEYGIEF